MLRTDRNRGHQVSAKHSSFGQALENLLQGHGLSVSNCNAMTYTLPPLNALRAFEAARHLSFKLAAHELHVTPAASPRARSHSRFWRACKQCLPFRKPLLAPFGP